MATANLTAPRLQLTADRLREVLDYDPGTGLFRWRIQTSRRISVGDIAGSRHGAGYTQINVDGSNYLAHRLAWLHMHGEWPKKHIDHINADRTDNRAENMRDIPQGMNNQNITKPYCTGSSGLLGVSWSKKEKGWTAQISINNQTVRIGIYPTKELAHAAYLDAKRRLHDGCTI